MKKVLFSFLFLFSFFIGNSQTWTQITDYAGTARDDGAVFVINNKAYCFTGFQVGYTCTRDGFVLDGGTETWGNMSSLPLGDERQYANGFSYNGYGYLFGGLNCSNVCSNDLWQYNPILDSWQTLAPMPDSGRMGCSCFVINDKAYLVGGRTTSVTIKNQVWEYDITNNSWQQKNNLPFIGTWRGTGFSIDTTGYVCYGIMPSLSFNHLIYSYNKNTDVWTAVPSLSLTGRTYIGQTVINNKACMYGGLDSTGVMKNDFIVFDPQVPSLTIYNGIPAIPRKGGMAFSLNNKFYITTGIDTTITRVKETWRNDEPTAITQINNVVEYKVYPNPTNGIAIVNFNSVNYKNSSLQLTELSTGKIVLRKNISSNVNQLEIDMKDFSAGIYSLSIQTDLSAPAIIKIVKIQ